MWRWRDWVIDAYNRNLPFDRFTIEQLAGDLLPGATLDQQIATGFNRNHRGNGEGGIIPEEYAVEYVVDRVDTTATVWLGLTIGCARCHNHKFDPVTQEEFYRLFAFFNNVPENGRAVKYGNSPPLHQGPDPRPATGARPPRRHRIGRALERRLAAPRAGDRVGADPPGRSSIRRTPGDRLVRPRSTGIVPDPAVQGDRRAPRHDSPVDAGDVARFGFYDRFTLAAWIKPDGPRAGRSSRGWSTSRRARATASSSTGARSRSTWSSAGSTTPSGSRRRQRVAADRWTHVAVTYDGSRVADGVQRLSRRRARAA